MKDIEGRNPSKENIIQQGVKKWIEVKIQLLY